MYNIGVILNIMNKYKIIAVGDTYISCIVYAINNNPRFDFQSAPFIIATCFYIIRINSQKSVYNRKA